MRPTLPPSLCPMPTATGWGQGGTRQCSGDKEQRSDQPPNRPPRHGFYPFPVHSPTPALTTLLSCTTHFSCVTRTYISGGLGLGMGTRKKCMWECWGAFWDDGNVLNSIVVMASQL